MLLRTLTLRHFRNVPLATLEFTGSRQYLLGPNGQGKTNLLEAAGFLTALRSFRTADPRLLVMQGETEAAVAADIDHETSGPVRVTVKLRRDGKELWWGEERVLRLADHLGRFPTVVFSSQDLQLVRGAPAGRRRWLDLTLAAMDPGYLRALQAYTRALAGRNQLLKRGVADPRQLSAFEQPLAAAGAEVLAARERGVAALSQVVATAYARVAEGREVARLRYEGLAGPVSVGQLLAQLESGRPRDAAMRTTLTGPHRDDLVLEVGGADAKDFASEGQQRSAALALRLAQAAWFQEKSGVRPVLLADDVLGELDEGRRRRFWAALDPRAQVIATGTSPADPGLGDWQVFAVAAGAFSPNPPAMGGPA